MPATSNIPFGSLLSQLRQRQLDEYAAAEEKKKKKAAFTNQMAQVIGMGAGAALAGPLGMGVMAGVGMGGTASGLLGNAATGTPVSMNQGIGAAMQVGGLMDRNARTTAYQEAIDADNTLTEPSGAVTQMNSMGSIPDGDTLRMSGNGINGDWTYTRKGATDYTGMGSSATGNAGGSNIGDGALAMRRGGGGFIDSLGTGGSNLDRIRNYNQTGGVAQDIRNQTLYNNPGSAFGGGVTGLSAIKGARQGLGGGIPITPEIAQTFLAEADGDADLARQMAREAGYTF